MACDLRNFNISLAFTFDWHPQTYLLSSNISLSQITCDCRNPVQKQPQLQHVPSVSSVPLDSLKLNCTGSVSFDSVVQDITVYFGHQFILTPILAQSQHPEFYVP